MSLEKLDIHSVRNIQRASIEPSSHINFIVGDNASGKTSLLEAIYMLGRAYSFRTSTMRQAIQFKQKELIVSGQVRQQTNSLTYLGIQLDHSQCLIRINQENKNKAELAYSLPLLLIHPKSYQLLDGSPQIRREFLDWGVFNEENDFLIAWRKFKKTLQHRNALLKNNQMQQIHVWNIELIQYGTIVSQYRNDYLVKLRPVFFKICDNFLTFNQIELNYLSGWGSSETFADTLNNDYQKDLRYGFTHSGPHRCDFQLKVDEKIAKDYVSRGQLKLLMLALKLAQVVLVSTSKNNNVCLLIDDLTAELDATNKKRLLDYLSSLNCQVFMTATALSDFGALDGLEKYKVFHVKHGVIEQINIG